MKSIVKFLPTVNMKKIIILTYSKCYIFVRLYDLRYPALHT